MLILFGTLYIRNEAVQGTVPMAMETYTSSVQNMYICSLVPRPWSGHETSTYVAGLHETSHPVCM